MARKKIAKPDQELYKAFETVMSFPEGQTVLRHILELTEYHSDLKRLSPTGELNADATIYNLGRRDVWIGIRPYLTSEQQIALEVVAEREKRKRDREAEILDSINEDKE